MSRANRMYFLFYNLSFIREAFIKKKNMENSIIGLTPPPFSAKIMEKMMYFFLDTRPLFEHFGDFFLFCP